jgi:glycosyltransferase involved in cell wall biosynthesis
VRILLLGLHHGEHLRGASTAIHGLAHGLAAAGHELTLVQAARPEHRRTLPGMRSEYVGTTRKSLYPLRYALRKVGSFDVVHGNDQAAAGFVLRQRVQAIPLVAELHPPRVHAEGFLRSGWRTRYIGLAARHAGRVLVPSRWLADELSARYGTPAKRLHVIPHGVGSHWFEPLSAVPAGGPPRVALVNMKGVDVALRAFARIAQRFDACLDLYGASRATPELQQLAEELGVADRTVFRGFVANTELPRQLSGASLLLHPTPAESFGQVLAEAAAQGVPAVTSRVGAVPEVVLDNETGLLCPADDVDAFAKALEQLLGDTRLRDSMGDAARARAERIYRWEHVVQRVVDEVYAPLLRG